MITHTAMSGSRGPGSIGIVGTGSYLPSRVVTNSDVGERAGVSDEWITSKTRIRQRRWAKPEESTSDLAFMAARAAIDNTGISATDVRLVVLATSTPDSPQPATAPAVADMLGTPPGTAAFDINAVCSGFGFGVATATGILGDLGGYAVVVGADIYSRIVNPADRRTAVLFGDGAGAVVVGPEPEGDIVAGELASFGAARDLIEVPAGGSKLPPSSVTVSEGLHYFTMNGRGVRDFVADTVAPAISEFLTELRLPPDAIDHFIPHQANGEMLAELAESVRIPESRMRTSLREYGNTGAASIPVTLDHAARDGLLRPCHLVLLAGFGGGMSMSLTLVQY